MSPSLIIDCSVTMSWCFADEATVETERLQDRLVTEAALVPMHWHLEVANVLVVAERKRRISAADATQFVQLLQSLDIAVDDESPAQLFERLLPLCRNHQLTSYDAAYLDLALRRRLPLATLDDDLRRAAFDLGVALLGQ